MKPEEIKSLLSRLAPPDPPMGMEEKIRQLPSVPVRRAAPEMSWQRRIAMAASFLIVVSTLLALFFQNSPQDSESPTRPQEDSSVGFTLTQQGDRRILRLLDWELPIDIELGSDGLWKVDWNSRRLVSTCESIRNRRDLVRPIRNAITHLGISAPETQYLLLFLTAIDDLSAANAFLDLIPDSANNLNYRPQATPFFPKNLSNADATHQQQLIEKFRHADLSILSTTLVRPEWERYLVWVGSPECIDAFMKRAETDPEVGKNRLTYFKALADFGTEAAYRALLNILPTLTPEERVVFRKEIKLQRSVYVEELKTQPWYDSQELEAALREPARGLRNEQNASNSLKTLTTAEADFRSNDRDQDLVNNFWVRDVAGLYGIVQDPANPQPIRLIEAAIAGADKTQGKGVYPSVPPDSSKAGYFYAAIRWYRDSTGQLHPYDDGSGRNNARFGMTSYPAEYGKGGKLTFIVNEEATLYSKDTNGIPPQEFPADPAAEGWTRVE